MTAARAAAILGAVNAVLVLIDAFGVGLTETQRYAVYGAVNAVLIAVGAFLYKQARS